MEKINFLNIFFNKNLEFFFNKLLLKIEYGTLIVFFPDNKKIIYKGREYGPIADIKLNNFKIIKDIIIKGNIGFGESYMNKNFSTSNLSNLIELIVINKSSFNKIDNGKFYYRFSQKFFHYIKKNSKKNSLNNISYHYDLGNEFYKYWLDETMSYSSALFENNIFDLKKAQINKYSRLMNLIKPSDNSKILEIGCGWGALATYIAKNTNAHVTALTISQEQYKHVSKMIYEEGLNENIKVELKDYRDVDEKFNSIVSVEMFEAVGQKYWKIFFNKIKDSLINEGRVALQIITIKDELFDNYKNRPDFIQRYIFPGGMLPSKEILKSLINNHNLKLQNEYSFAVSYAKTLNEWNKRFQKSWPEISKKGFNEYFKRMWEYYFAYCESGFKTGNIDISQFLISK